MATKKFKPRVSTVILFILLVLVIIYAFVFRDAKGIYEDQLDKKQAEIKTLTSQVEDLKGDKQTLQKKLDNSVPRDSLLTVQDELDALKKQIANLPEDPCADLQAKLNKAQDDLKWYKQDDAYAWGQVTHWKNKYNATQTTQQVETQTRILAPQDNEGKLKVIPVIEEDLLTIFLDLPSGGECFWDMKKKRAVDAETVIDKTPYLHLFNHNEKIKGMYNEVDNAFVFNLRLSRYPDRKFEFNFFIDNERYWEMTETGYTPYLYIDTSVGRYGYHFHIDQNGLVVSDGNQGD